MIYYDLSHPASYGDLNKLYNEVQRVGVYTITRRELRDWLKKQDPYTLHKSATRRFPSNRILVSAMDHQWEMDLVDLGSLLKYNRGYRFLLTCIDVLSKYAWVVPLKNKTGTTILRAIKQMFSSGRMPNQIYTDRGGEFIYKHVQGFLKDSDIHYFTTNNETKASVVERFNRTLKSKMWKDFTHRNSLKYIDVLPKLVEGYNKSYHRSIKMRPVDVTKENEGEVWLTLYPSNERKPNNKFKFMLWEKVRIAKFEKGYLPNWSEEVFTVVKRKTKPIPVYKLEDWDREAIEGNFYEHDGKVFT